MKVQNKTKEELIIGLKELQQEYNSLKSSYEKEITDRKEVEEEILRQSRELATLLRISQEFATTLDLAKILQMTTDLVTELTELESSAIYLLEGETLRLWATTPPLPPQFPDELRNAPLADHPHIHKAITTGLPIFLFDTEKANLTAAERAVCELRSLRSILYLPLFIGTHALGVLIVTSSEELQTLSEADINLFNTFANLAAMGVGNARLYESQKSYARELENRVVELKQAEEARMKSERRYHDLFTQANEGLLIMTLDGQLSELNQSFANMHGYTVEELKKSDISELDVMREKTMSDRSDLVSSILAGKVVRFEVEHYHKDGHIFPLSVTVSLVDIGGQQFFLAFHQDITERKQAEQELIKAKEKAEESERQLKLITDNFVDGMIYQITAFDENKRKFNYISDTVMKLYGCTPEQAKENSNLIYGKIHPDDIDGLIQKEKEALIKMSIFRTECRVINPNGSIRWAYYVSQPRLINEIVCWDGLEVDITARKNIETELIISKEKAEESDRLKSAFLANMSHEIRTPMNGILGFTELLKEPNLTSEEQQDFIQTIQISGARMLNTINSIVDMSKIESGLINVNIKQTNINENIEFTYKFFKPEVENKGLQFIFKNGLHSKEAIIKTDNEKVYGILTNLVRNAIKFTYEGSIEFGYVLKSGTEPGSTEQNRSAELEFFVKDTGVGISENQQQLIFERFRQGSESNDRGYEGSGLGLSICKSYVEMLAGKIWVESEVGRGSIFYFTIPYNPVLEETHIIENVVFTENKKVLVKKLKILIVEDDKISYAFLTRVIQKISTEVLHVITGVQAVEACRNNPDLDLVLMDIRMPQMDGLEATQQIRQFNKDVIIIAQSGYAFASDREKAIEAGCNDYITKPINKALLYELIKKYIKHN